MDCMKKSMRLFVLVMLVLTLFAALSVNAGATVVDNIHYGRQTLEKRQNSKVCLYVYDKLAVECASFNQHRFKLDGSKEKLTIDELKDVFNIFLNDYPEYFWLTGGYKYSADEQTNEVLEIEPLYLFSRNQILNMNNQLQAKIKSMTSGLASKSDYDKSLILHDRLAAAVRYESTEYDQNVYGALVDGKAVCAGYAKAYQLLLQSVGIPCWYIRGSSTMVGTNDVVNHGWNLVSIDGKWYYTDVTWDDQGNTVYHAYFNLPFEVMEEDHTAVDFREYLPVANSTDANYFYKNNLVINSFDPDSIAKILIQNRFITSLYVAGDVNAVRTAFESRDEVFKIVQSTQITNRNFTYSFSSLGREIKLEMDLLGSEYEHKHLLGTEYAKEPTCQEEGHKRYFFCAFCGKYFSDLGSVEITDLSTVILPKTDHTPSGAYAYDTDEHWQNCTVCHETILDMISPHTDTDGDSKCDSCEYVMPKETQSEQTENDAVQKNDTDVGDSDTINTPLTLNTKNIIILAAIAVGIVGIICIVIGISKRK